MPDAIACSGLSKRYGNVVALQNLDLAVPQGSIFGFLGPNGAGKSTTIRILATLARPTSGDALVMGASVTASPDQARRSVGYLPQEPAFPGWMRGREFLHFEAELAGVPVAERAARVDEVLETVGLTEAGNRRAGGYSGGMKQRLGFAQALLGRPPVLILDEPISSLDPLGRRDVIDVMAGLRGQSTVFFSSHILADIDRICDHVAILDRGHLVAQSTMIGLKEQYAQPIFLVEVAGDPALLVRSLQAESWVQDVTAEAGRLRILVRDIPRAETALPRAVLDAGLVLLRYEQVLPSLEDVFVRLVGAEASVA